MMIVRMIVRMVVRMINYLLQCYHYPANHPKRRKPGDGHWKGFDLLSSDHYDDKDDHDDIDRYDDHDRADMIFVKSFTPATLPFFF